MKLQKPSFSYVFSQFLRKYSLSKTLKFELKPTVDTKQYLRDFIDSDTNRAKIIIDESMYLVKMRVRTWG